MADIKAQNETALASVKAIYDAADEANTLLDGMQTAATQAGTTLNGIYATAVQAEQSASDAQASADSASEYASRALGNLASVQSVTETLNWITAHGTMTLTSDVALDPSHVYFVVDANGDYVVGGTHYSVVSEPVLADIGSYYELSINESLNNYVATHLVVDTEGLWIIPDAGGNKVLIATGSGSTYTTAGTYIVGASGTLASFTATGATIGQNVSGQSHTVISSEGMQVYRNESGTDTQIVNLGYGLGNNDSGGQSYAPYTTLGTRLSGSVVGNYSVAEGRDVVASGALSHAEGLYSTTIGSCSHAEGAGTTASGGTSHAEGSTCTASGFVSHAEGEVTVASGEGAHAEGIYCIASGDYSHAEGHSTHAEGLHSHAQNYYTIASQDSQTALGKYNLEDVNNKYAVIVGNGTAVGARSNALTVDWSGNVVASGEVTDGSGITLSSLYHNGIIVVSSATFTSLPQTITYADITSEHVAVNWTLTNPSAQAGDWTVTTSNGSVTIDGTISGSTAITLYLAPTNTADKNGVLVVSDTITSLPKTITNADISVNHVLLNSVLSVPSLQTDDWTVTTSDGSVTITGTKASGSTDITLYLGNQTA